MTIEGRVTVDGLFHDKAGTAAIKIISMAKSDSYGSNDVVAQVSGTLANNSSTSINIASLGAVDASGNAIAFEHVDRILFQWSGSYPRTLSGETFAATSLNNKVAASCCDEAVMLSLGSGTGEGAYSIVLIGTPA